MRCFVAIDLDEGLKEGIVGVQESFDYVGMKKVERQNMHMTLKFLGEISENKIEDSHSTLRLIASRFKPFGVELCGVGVFPDARFARVLWIGMRGEEMLRLCRETDDAFLALGFPKEKDIVPHLTIGRIKHMQDKSRFIEDLKKHANLGLGKMEINSIRIKRSILSPSGPVYSDLKEVNL